MQLMAEQRLTVVEADARLPFVGGVAADAVDASARLRAAEAAFRAERTRPQPSQIVLNDGRREIERLRRTLAEFVSEAAAVGALLGDPAAGIVDFPSSLDGSEIRLCWRIGEARVEHYHNDGEDHDSRRDLPVPVHA